MQRDGGVRRPGVRAEAESRFPPSRILPYPSTITSRGSVMTPDSAEAAVVSAEAR